MTRLRCEEITQERFQKWAEWLSQERGTPVLLFGAKHDDPLAKVLVIFPQGGPWTYDDLACLALDAARDFAERASRGELP